jgi:hypothetical protein
VQLTLSFLTPPSNNPVEPPPWADLDPTARVETIEILARMIANTVPSQDPEEVSDHD